MTTALQKPILIMAGGTGGHIFPALTVAKYLRRKGESIVWLGTPAGLESHIVPAANITIEWLDIQGLRGKGKLALLLAPLRILRACWQVYRILLRIKPKAVLGMGGFVSGPGGLMAWVLGIPLILHEQNSVTGLTNRLLSRLARQNYFAFSGAASGVPRSVCIGNPVREDLLDIESPTVRLNRRLNDRMNLLVIGGSLGAMVLNQQLPAAVALLEPAHRPRIRHQCGSRHLDDCQQRYRDLEVEAEVVGFIDDMCSAYAWADLVVCRAGALTISELMVVGVAAILIPYPHAVDDHQLYNAKFLQQHQAADILLQTELSPNYLAALLRGQRQDRMRRITQAENAYALAPRDATERLAQGLLACAKS